MSFGDYLILAGVGLWLATSFGYMYRRRRQGKCIGCSGCSGGCAGCPKKKTQGVREI